MKMRLLATALLLFALLVTACKDAAPPSGSPNSTPPEQTTVAPPAERPSTWATPITDQPGLGNLYKVSDHLYRGQQPEEEGFASLKKMGIKTVVNLRSMHSDRDECREAGLDYVHIKMQAWEGDEAELVDFLKVVNDPGRWPVFVHCQHGADRTGIACATYRMAVQGWSRDEALREMTEGDYGFHSIWQNLIDLIKAVDIEKLKREAGMTEEPSQ